MTASEIQEEEQNEQGFETAKEELKSRYQTADLKLVGETNTELLMQYGEAHFVVTEEDIREFADTATLRAESMFAPDECGIVSPGYREQVIQPLDPIRWRYLPPLELGFRFGEASEGEPLVAIGAATTEFVNTMRFDPVYFEICLERMSRAPVGDTPLDIRHGFYKPPTIRVHNLREKTIKAALDKSDSLFSYCFFELAYLKHLPVGLADEWPARRRAGEDTFQFAPEYEGTVLPLPKAEYNPDIIQFYQLGISSRVPVMQFWAFYQVLEYHFARVGDENLHRQLASRLKDPRFKPSPTQLDRVVQDVIDHLETADPLYMLISVLNRFIDEEQLVEFIRAYEAYLDTDHYTRRRRLFGEDIQVKLTPGTVIENVSRTIMAVRDALLYSPDRVSRTARTIGYDHLTEMVRPEIPLIKHLAEQVIIGSAD